VFSVGWPLGDIILLSRPLQNVSRGSLVEISVGSGLFWGQQANFSSVLLFLRSFRFLRVMSVYLIILIFTVHIHKGVTVAAVLLHIS
jgi:hypothetical protein